MAIVTVPAARATLTESPDGLLISIPAKKNWPVILFLGFWLTGWLLGEVTVIFHMLQVHLSHRTNVIAPGTNLTAHTPMNVSVSLFLLVWLAGWTIGGAFAIATWLWNIAGFEKVLVGPSTLTTRREVLGIGPSKEYELGSVSNLRVNMGASNVYFGRSSFQIFSGNSGTIAFDYGAKTFHFGMGLDEAEAQQIIERLGSRHTF
jgi:hypothetical protein